MPTQQHMKAVLQGYIDGFNAGDPAAVVELFAEDAVIEDPVGHPPIKGRTALTEFYRNAMAAGAKLKLDAPIRGSHADSVAMAFSVELPGLRIHVIDVMTFNPDGKVIHMAAYWGPDDIDQ